MGFVIPPMLVPDDDNVEHNLSVMFYSVAAITTLLFIVVALVFQSEPARPPSIARVAVVERVVSTETNSRHFLTSVRTLLTNRPFLLLLLTYGINVGCYYAVSTLLNRIILFYFPGEQVNAGRLGLVIIVSGLAGSVLCGLWLDRTKAFKKVTMLVYFLSFTGMMAFTFLMMAHRLWLIFLMAAFLGFFMTGYLPIGFEFGAELTYPEAEGTSSGLLNASAQLFGIVLTIVSGRMMDGVHIMAGNLFMCLALCAGTTITYLIKSDLRRHRITHSSSQSSTCTTSDLVGPVDDSVFDELIAASSDGSLTSKPAVTSAHQDVNGSVTSRSVTSAQQPQQQQSRVRFDL